MPRPLVDIIQDAIRMYDHLIELKTAEDLGIDTFDSEKAGQIMEEYELLKREYRTAVALARKIGIDLSGLPEPFGYVSELDNE